MIEIIDKLIELIKIILEKYFFPAILATIATILVDAFWPDILQISSRVGVKAYSALFFLLFLVFFIAGRHILLEAIERIKSKRKTNAEKAAQKEREEQIQKEREAAYKEVKERELEKLWSYMDSISCKDRKLVYSFIETNNAPIIRNEEYGTILSDQSIVLKMEYRKYTEQYNSIPNLNNEDIMVMPIFHSPEVITEYKYRLKDDVFDLLVYSMKNYGRITHFAEDEQ